MEVKFRLDKKLLRSTSLVLDLNSTEQVGEKEKPTLKLTKKLSATEKDETSTAAVKPGLV